MERSTSERCSRTGGFTNCIGHIYPGQRLHTISFWATVLSLENCGGPGLLRVHHTPDHSYLSKVILAEAACYQIMEVDMYGRHRSHVGCGNGIYRIL